ncbi:uncharacterized protein LOC106870244 [Octopus bimaculoides]|uniref:uncharacterized protein LOC106870244 n=1 Tax=Octopus bimaculoides TaxID=37653 RepID=UPI00071C20FA|nr:uncharacterized protein LOC106870244 [Octopus bimaculoides]|eukprot:XP_014771747.1 PREDICTED: uncharacterized protein LOC106870244 [Octopus bimaculoides]
MPWTNECHKRFRYGRTTTEGVTRSGKSSTSRNEEPNGMVRRIVMEDCRAIIQEISHEVGNSTESVHSILSEDLCVAEKEKGKQKQLLMEITQGMHYCASHDPDFMKTIITGEEKWAYGLCSMRSVILREDENPTRVAAGN